MEKSVIIGLVYFVIFYRGDFVITKAKFKFVLF